MTMRVTTRQGGGEARGRGRLETKDMTKERPLTAGELQKVKIVLSDALPYELSMLEAAVRYMQEDSFHALKVDNNYVDAFIRNATIETFWTHVRCLIEFFNRKNDNYEASSAGARDFTTNDYHPSEDIKNLYGDNSLKTRINEQISHVGFCRKAEEWNKLGRTQETQMHYVKDIINTETKKFVTNLKPSFSQYWKGSVPQARFLDVPNQAICATNAIITTMLKIKY
jgi:hypothetical protein